MSKVDKVLKPGVGDGVEDGLSEKILLQNNQIYLSNKLKCVCKRQSLVLFYWIHQQKVSIGSAHPTKSEFEATEYNNKE